MNIMVSTAIDIRENVPLSSFTTFGVGGRARYFVQVTSEEEAIRAFVFARERDLSPFILGGGSNVLVSDDGFSGLVILNRIKGFTLEKAGSNVVVRAGGGEDWQDFTDRCIEEGWQGVECLAGIPGTVGASPVQNVGAYGQEVSQVISRVRCLETTSGKFAEFAGEECAFGYRQSIFNTKDAGKYLITSVTFSLVKDGAPTVTYRELEERLSDVSSPNLADVRDAVTALRDGKGLLVSGGRESYKSAGSFFKNPVVTTAQFARIEPLVARHGGGKNWAWPLLTDDVKLSAACLIRCSGFDKGYRQGNVGISPCHTLILVNYGGASAREIVDFAAEVQRRVLDRFGVLLLPEARLTGFNSSPLEGAPSYRSLLK
jgi:UDP-N-acetylmuramate dehydrogenase